MTISKLASEPVRPNLPILGMRYETWCNHYRKDLSAHLSNGGLKYLDSFEWEVLTKRLFDLQTLDEAIREKP